VNPLYVRLSPGWPDRSPDAPVVLLLHGLGSNEDDLPLLAPWLPRGLPWVSVRAPLEMNFGGASWFPLDLPNEPEQAGIDAATDAIWAWVDANIPAGAPVVPLGFSQGGLMALQLLRTRPERIAATVVLSGLIARGDQPADDALASISSAESRPPVFWGRGDADAVIWPEAIARLAAWLPEHATATTRVYAGLAHGVNGEEMDDVKAFLSANL
jgi:phospholipase/carboxylesterase